MSGRRSKCRPYLPSCHDLFLFSVFFFFGTLLFLFFLLTPENDGSADCVAMILDKIRHRRPEVALRALTLLEAVAKNCGAVIHEVVGKFRFLNEFIKMVSPKVSRDNTFLRKNTNGLRSLSG